MNMLKRLIRLPKKFLQLPLIPKVVITLVVAAGLWFAYTKIYSQKTNQAQYQTAAVENGTLVVSVTGSGQVSTANSAAVTTQATGVVSEVLVQDGDEVKSGDAIAKIDPDMAGKQNEAQALASYQSAKNNLESAKSSLYTLQSAMLGQWKDHYDLATNSTYQNADGTPNNDNRALADFHISEDDWLAAEAKYKNQQNVVAQAQTSLNSAWLSYQQSSSTIYAPISGTISGLSLQVGSVVTGSSSSSSTTTSSTKIASVKTQAPPTITINLTEIDVPKIKVGNKATVTFDALTDKTYTGKVISIDTTGVVSSGVTTYPTVIRLDTDPGNILGSMAASANIITEIKQDILLVPNSSITTQNGISTIQVMKNNKVDTVNVEVGLSSDSQTEVLSGVSEGDTVVTSTIQSGTSPASQGQSVFSSFGGARGSGGNFIRTGR
ncbi:efflux RND transporter periplasmic adaptor subunit [Candidatus Woesebacteria bacterium]|nr:efflux RND transporter periplasmic adaptor subunit [Candidatus Woesebacteria bacterium]